MLHDSKQLFRPCAPEREKCHDRGWLACTRAGTAAAEGVASCCAGSWAWPSQSTVVCNHLLAAGSLPAAVHTRRQQRAPNGTSPVMQLLYPELGVDMPERAYGADCRLYIKGQGINWEVRLPLCSSIGLLQRCACCAYAWSSAPLHEQDDNVLQSTLLARANEVAHKSGLGLLPYALHREDPSAPVPSCSCCGR